MADLPTRAAEWVWDAVAGRRASRARARTAGQWVVMEAPRGSDGRTDGRTGSPTGGRGGFLRRHRRTLGPLGVGFATLAVAELGHLAFRRFGWLALILGLALTLAAVLRGSARRERLFLGGFGAASTVWGVVGWYVGVNVLQLVLLIVVTAASVAWWRRYRVRGRIDLLVTPVRLVPVGEWWKLRNVRPELAANVRTWAGEMSPVWPPHVPVHVRTWWADFSWRQRMYRLLGGILNNWSSIARDAGLPRGSRARRATADKVSSVLYVTLKRGTTQRQAMKLEPAFESAFEAIPGTVRIEPEGDQANKIRVRWLHEDPRKAGMLPWDPSMVVRAAADRIRIGLYKDGRECFVSMADTLHTLVCGTTQWGKSTIVKVLVASLAPASDACVMVMDPKAAQRTGGLIGGEFPELRPTIAHLFGLRDAEAVFRGLHRVMVERKSILAESPYKRWDPRLGPFIVVILDEFRYLSPRAKELVLKLAQKCLFVGIRLVIVTQEPNLAAMGKSTELRGALARRICFRLQADGRIIRDIFGYEAEDRGWRPGTLPRKGDFYMAGDGLDLPIEIQGLLPTDEQLQEIGETYRCIDMESRSRRAFLDASMPEIDEEERLAEEEEAASNPGVVVLPQPGSVAPPPAARGPWTGEEGRLLDLMLRIIREAQRPLSGRQIQELAGIGPDGKDILKQNFLYDRHPLPGNKKTGGALREASRRGLIEETAEGWIYVAHESSEAAASS